MENEISVEPSELTKKNTNVKGDEKQRKKKHDLYAPKTLSENPKCRHKNKSVYKCSELTSNDIFHFHKKFYNSNNKIDQDHFILRNVIMTPVKRKRPRNNTRNERALSKQYFVIKHKTNERVPVCLPTFCGILKIKQGRIKGVTNRFALTGERPSERRGGDRNYHVLRSKKEAVKNVIMKVQPLESNYCRGKIKRIIPKSAYL